MEEDDTRLRKYVLTPHTHDMCKWIEMEAQFMKRGMPNRKERAKKENFVSRERGVCKCD